MNIMICFPEVVASLWSWVLKSWFFWYCMLGILGISLLIKVTKVATLGIDNTEDSKF